MSHYLSKVLCYTIAMLFLVAALGWVTMNIMFGVAIIQTVFNAIFGG